MDISAEILIDITNWAGLFFTPAEICILLELDHKEFLFRFLDEEDPVYKAYQKGKLTAQAELRKKVKKIAGEGSPAAQIMVEHFMKTQKLGE